MTSANRTSTPHYLALLLLTAAVFLSLLGRKDIVTSHEARVAQVGRIMARSGWMWDAKPVSIPVVTLAEIAGGKEFRPDPTGARMDVNPWLVPVINDHLRLQKPPLPYWVSACVFRFAGFGVTQARLVPALLGMLCVLLIADVARMLLGHRAALIAAGVWCSTHFIVDEFRKSMADPYLAFFTLVCVWSWFRATALIPLFSGDAKRSLSSSETPQHMQQSNALRFASRLNGGMTNNWILLFYISLALGALAKGPVVLIVVFIPIVIHHLLLRRPLPARLSAHALGTALFLAIVLPWPIYVIRHVPNALTLWRYESLGEMTGENIEKARPWHTYIGHCFQLPLPWTPIWISGLVLPFLRGIPRHLSPRARRRFVPILWQACIVIFFSISSVKKPAYLLPVMAAQTLIITDALLVVIAFARVKRFRAMPGILAMMQALIGIGFAAGLMVALLHSPLDRTTAALCGSATIVMASIPFMAIANRCARNWLTAQITSYGVILIVLLGAFAPALDNQRSARDFALAMQQYLAASDRRLLVHHLPEDLAVYLPLDLPNAGNAPYALLVIDHSRNDPEETLDRLSQLLGDARVTDARRIDLKTADGNGRWRLFEVTLGSRQI